MLLPRHNEIFRGVQNEKKRVSRKRRMRRLGYKMDPYCFYVANIVFECQIFCSRTPVLGDKMPLTRAFKAYLRDVKNTGKILNLSTLTHVKVTFDPFEEHATTPRLI